jgi:LasA protease
MMKPRKLKTNKLYPFLFLMLVVVLLAGCVNTRPGYIIPQTEEPTPTPEITLTPYPSRPVYDPGTLVEYTAQSGDTLDALAARFNCTVDEIRKANTFIPEDVTTLPPGMPMEMPIYYQPLWGIDFQIIPDSAYVNGPSSRGFNTVSYINSSAGWFKYYSAFSMGRQLSAAELIVWIAENYSISPKVLLALIEYQKQALTNTERDEESEETWLGFDDTSYYGVYLQISYAANLLNHGFYLYREGKLTSFEHLDGRIEKPDPWQNAATVALQYYFSRLYDGDVYKKSISPEGYFKTYMQLFGDPWADDEPAIPGTLTQPELQLPFAKGQTWAYTGGPHTGWGNLSPWSAIDFAPPASIGGCTPSDLFAVAVADGVVARTGPGIVVLDLDEDGDERTGWVIFYLHIAEKDRVTKGTVVKAGDAIGHPSCEGGRSTGTHIHIGRKYNGEWISADGIIPFNLDGWVAKNGALPYSGFMVKDNWTVRANPNPDSSSFITAK